MDHLSQTKIPVLIVDDEWQTLQSCRIVLRTSGISPVLLCQDSREVLKLLSEKEVGLLLLDLSMPHLSGQELMPRIREEYPEIPVIIITGADEVETAVECMKQGAFDYMVKPVEKSRLVSGVKKALNLIELERENRLLRKRILSQEIECPDAFSEIITNNESMRSIFQYVEAIATTNRSVLITGETGVGKELMARAIHKLSGVEGGFVAVNVSGLDDNLFADTLFGHAKGAFTGAGNARAGLVEKAAGGVLFLDEIGELISASQVKLLRLIQEREYMPLGSDTLKSSKARILVATNQELMELMKGKRFRKDLYYRLRTHHIHLPPLRERIDDVPLLVDHFLTEAADALGKRKPTPPAELYTLLSTYHFPGNIRELQSMVFDAVSKHKARKLSLESFKSHIFRDGRPMEGRRETSFPKGKSPVSFSERLPTIKEATRQLVLEAMKRAKGNQSIASRLLGISQQALSSRLKRMEEEQIPQDFL